MRSWKKDLVLWLQACLITLVMVLIVIGVTSFTHPKKNDFDLTFTPTYDPYIHPGYPGQEDSLPTSPGGSCSIEVTITNSRSDHILSGIVVQAHDLVADTSATLFLNQALYVGPNVLLPKKEVSLGSFLIGFATRDTSLPCSLSLSYDITWERLNREGKYVGTYFKKDFPLTLVLPPLQKK